MKFHTGLVTYHVADERWRRCEANTTDSEAWRSLRYRRFIISSPPLEPLRGVRVGRGVLGGRLYTAASKGSDAEAAWADGDEREGSWTREQCCVAELCLKEAQGRQTEEGGGASYLDLPASLRT